MSQEELLFSVFAEFMLLSELHDQLDDEQVGNVVESVTSLFDSQSPEVIARFLEFVKALHVREMARGAVARANVLESVICHYSED